MKTQHLWSFTAYIHSSFSWNYPFSDSSRTVGLANQPAGVFLIPIPPNCSKYQKTHTHKQCFNMDTDPKLPVFERNSSCTKLRTKNTRIEPAFMSMKCRITNIPDSFSFLNLQVLLEPHCFGFLFTTLRKNLSPLRKPHCPHVWCTSITSLSEL